jgi:hypothetical protein
MSLRQPSTAYVECPVPQHLKGILDTNCKHRTGRVEAPADIAMMEG